MNPQIAPRSTLDDPVPFRELLLGAAVVVGGLLVVAGFWAGLVAFGWWVW